MRKALWLLIFGFGLVTALMTLVFVTGPRMKRQPSLHAFDAVLPLAPSNSVPLQAYVTPAPSAEAAPALTNPVPDTAENRRRGRVYYEYYCVQCHGTAADGAGPVGASYVPAPTNLVVRVPQIASDGELLRRMLTGVGHSPVLERVVRPEYRWPLVRYLRHLDAASSP